MQDASTGLCNRMCNLVIYLYKPSYTHTVFSVLQSARIFSILLEEKGGADLIYTKNNKYKAERV